MAKKKSVRTGLTSRQQVAELKRLKLDTAAKLLSVSQRTILNWDVPRNEDGTYDAMALVQWLTEHRVEQKAKQSAGSYDTALDRKRLAEAELAELKLAREQRRVVDADHVRLMFAQVATHLRKASEIIQKQSRDCYEVLLKGLEDAQSEFEARFESADAEDD